MLTKDQCILTLMGVEHRADAYVCNKFCACVGRRIFDCLDEDIIRFSCPHVQASTKKDSTTTTTTTTTKSKQIKKKIKKTTVATTSTSTNFFRTSTKKAATTTTFVATTFSSTSTSTTQQSTIYENVDMYQEDATVIASATVGSILAVICIIALILVALYLRKRRQANLIVGAEPHEMVPMVNIVQAAQQPEQQQQQQPEAQQQQQYDQQQQQQYDQQQYQDDYGQHGILNANWNDINL